MIPKRLLRAVVCTAPAHASFMYRGARGDKFARRPFRGANFAVKKGGELFPGGIFQGLCPPRAHFCAVWVPLNPLSCPPPLPHLLLNGRLMLNSGGRGWRHFNFVFSFFSWKQPFPQGRVPRQPSVSFAVKGGGRETTPPAPKESKRASKR